MPRVVTQSAGRVGLRYEAGCQPRAVPSLPDETQASDIEHTRTDGVRAISAGAEEVHDHQPTPRTQHADDLFRHFIATSP
jgi:hypothetical protein